MSLAEKVKRWKVSPSQVKTFRECERKWGFRYIDGIETPPKPSAFFGSVVHELLENYFKCGELTPGKLFQQLSAARQTQALRVARSALPHYPTPGESSLVTEGGFVYEYGGVTWRGYIDLIHDGDLWTPFHHELQPDIVINDHKTSRDPEKWGLTAAELPEDEQFLIYAGMPVIQHGVDLVGAQWTYLRTEGAAKGIPVRAVVEAAHVKNALEPIVDTGHRILKVLSSTTTANDLPPTVESCGNFGGCPYAELGVCRLSREQKLDSLFNRSDQKQEPMPTLKEMLEAKKQRTNSKGQMAPLRTADLKVVENGPRPINSPETPKDVSTKRETSKAIGNAAKLGGNREEKKDRARQIAEAAQAEPKEAASATSSVVENAAATEQARKSPSQEVLLEWLCTGKYHRFVSKSKAATPEMPYCHGRTLNSMKKNGLLNFRKEEGGIYNVMPTEAGRQKYGQKPSAPAARRDPVPAAEDMPAVPETSRASTRDSGGRDMAAVWLQLAEIADGDVDQTEELYEAYKARFG